VSKNNTGMAALRAGLPVITINDNNQRQHEAPHSSKESVTPASNC